MATSSESLNLIVVCLDTFRADLVGEDEEFGFVKTPHLDSFAENAVCFTRAFGEGQPTLQMRRAFFTGKRSFPWRFNFDRRGHWHHAPGWHKIPPDQDTLAEVLLQRGYMTGLVADTYHMFKPTMNYTRGFVNYEFVRGQESDNWRGGTLGQVEEQLNRHVRHPSHASPVLIQYLLNMKDRKAEEDYLCARVFGSASQWLKENHENGPFFLWVDSFDPHEPWDPPPNYAEMYSPGYQGLDFIMPGTAYAGGDPSGAELERIKALYFGEATLVDRWVGRLFETLETLHLWEKSIVMVTCDHGTQILDQGRFGKGADELHPFNTRILWMVWHPESEKGQKIHALVQSHDFMPTALHLLGMEYAAADGENVWGLVTGERDRIREYAITGWAGWADGSARGRASVRDDRWNYCVGTGYPDDEPELFDLEADPKEIRNVASENPEIVTCQRERLEALLGRPVSAPMTEIDDRAAPPPMAAYIQARESRRQKESTS